MTLCSQLSPRIAFRTDASVQIGTGHVMRCLTLADALRERGAECVFICRPHAGNLLELIAKRGHRVVALADLNTKLDTSSAASAHGAWLGTDWANDAEDTLQALGAEVMDWLIVDHYALDHLWQKALRSRCEQIMVIDDLADREHDCDLLLDQNLGRLAQDYCGLLSASAIRLIGPQYALLRPEFAQLRAESLARRANPQLKHLLITMGGVDKDNVTGLVLNALNACSLAEELCITVVMGPHAPWLQNVLSQSAQMSRLTRVLVGVSDMAKLMADSDLAIGAAGSTSWERCCLGLPSIQLVLAENQVEVASALKNLDAVVAIDSIDNLFFEIKTAIEQMNFDKLQFLSKCAASVCDGHGAPFVAVELLRKLLFIKAGNE